MNRAFIKRVQQLQSIKPSSEWKTKTRDILLSQIRSQGTKDVAVPFSQKTFVFLTEGARSAYHMTFGIVFARPFHLAAALSVLIVAGSGIVFVAERSLPGDPLYAVKQTNEEVRMAFVSPQDRGEAELERVSRRLAELRALSNAPLSDEQKEQQVGTVADTLSQNLSTAQESLDAIDEPVKAVSLANTIKQQTASTRQELGALKIPLGSQSKIADVQSSVQQADQKALEVIVDRGVSAGLTDAAIASQLVDEIRSMTAKLGSLEMKVTLATVNQPQSRDDLIKQKNEAAGLLEKAQEDIDKKEFKLALEKITKSKDTITHIERALRDTANNAPVDGKKRN
ncbi:MAG: DUF5667 domain-containing protein [Patescibacteria group bacterium]